MACESGKSKLLCVHLNDNDLDMEAQTYVFRKLGIQTSELHKANFIDVDQFEKHELELKGSKENKIHQYVHKLYKIDLNKDQDSTEFEQQMIRQDIRRSLKDDIRVTNSDTGFGPFSNSNVS